MKRIFVTVILLLIILCHSYASAAVFSIDADLNSISPIWYQSGIMPPYSANSLNTSLFVNSGDLLEISASGLWGNAYWLTFGPNGNPNENIVSGYSGVGYPVAALMGRIGNNSYFFVGSSYSNYANQSGILYLGFNDTDYGNNWGTVNTDVNVSPVPESATLSLLGLGLLGLAFRRKKTV